MSDLGDIQYVRGMLLLIMSLVDIVSGKAYYSWGVDVISFSDTVLSN